MSRRALTLLASIVAVGAVVAAPAVAATPRANLVDLEDEVMCVTCNVPLNIADSPQADDERNVIRGLIAKGETKAQIKDALVGQFGPKVLALPQASGVGITAYAIPIGVVALVAAGLALAIPRWRRRPPRGPGGEERGGLGDADLSDEDAARLDADLARYAS